MSSLARKKEKRAMKKAMLQESANSIQSWLELRDAKRRLAFLIQMRPEKRGKPRNAKKISDLIRKIHMYEARAVA